MTNAFMFPVNSQNFPYNLQPPADLGGRRIRPPADPKGPPFVLFWDIHFWLNDPKKFPRSSSAPNFSNFEGRARAEKTLFFSVKVF